MASKGGKAVGRGAKKVAGLYKQKKGGAQTAGGPPQGTLGREIEIQGLKS